MKKLLIPSLILATSTAVAAPFNTQEARSMGMGDTGVAHATPAAAPLFNPAMLSHGRSEKDYDFSMIIPNISANAIADKDAREGFENIADEGYLDEITNSINSFNSAAPGSAQKSAARTLSENTDALFTDLDKLSGKPINTTLSGLVSIAVPNDTFSVAVFANTTTTMEVIPNITDCDKQIMDKFAETANQIANGTSVTSSVSACGNTIYDSSSQAFNTNPSSLLTSNVTAVAVQINEYGITLAKPFDIAGQKVSFGITPKYQAVTSMFVNPTISQLDETSYDIGDELEKSETNDNAFNMDIGVATSFLDEAVTVGLTAKNLISNTYETAQQNGQTLSYEIKPQARAGVAWNLPMGLLVAADLDLTKNEAYFTDQATRYLGAGIEWDIFNTLRVRAGARSNLENSDDTAFTAGIGLNVLVVHLDLTGQVSENNAAAALQLGVEF